MCIEEISKSICTYFGSPICLLQEAHWHSASGRLFGSFECFARAGCDCSILVPRLLTSLVRSVDQGRDWFGIVLHSTIFLSMHILEHAVIGGRADCAFHEVSEFIYCSQDRYNGGRVMNIIIGMDANTTLQSMPNITYDIVGPGLLEPRPSHTAAMTSHANCVSLLGRAKAIHISTLEQWTYGRVEHGGAFASVPR